MVPPKPGQAPFSGGGYGFRLYKPKSIPTPKVGWGTGRDQELVRYPAKREISRMPGLPPRWALALRGPWPAPALRGPGLQGLALPGDGRCGGFIRVGPGFRRRLRRGTAPIVRITPPGASSQPGRSRSGWPGGGGEDRPPPSMTRPGWRPAGRRDSMIRMRRRFRSRPKTVPGARAARARPQSDRPAPGRGPSLGGQDRLDT